MSESDSIQQNVVIGLNCLIHPTSVIGLVPFEEIMEVAPARIGNAVHIGAFCVIESGVFIGDRVKIAHHVVIALGAEIGSDSLIVDAVRIDRRALVGKNCVIGGNVSDRAVIGDNVTFMGEMAHNYSDATEPWETTDEISPIIHRGTVVAQGAQIIGGISIGEGSYIAAGEIVRFDVPPHSFVSGGGKVRPVSSMRGLVRSRLDPTSGQLT
jgi:UDP-3-O-[3-hydroxymyristoyl] glucosamine N-acyltransferase